jgi:hypothetical protein
MKPRKAALACRHTPEFINWFVCISGLESRDSWRKKSNCLFSRAFAASKNFIEKRSRIIEKGGGR